MNVIFFYIIAAAILGFSILSVTSRKILRAATFLLFVLISTAALYFLLQVHFLAAVQLMVYAGGIAVLIIFSILLTSNVDFTFEKIDWKKQLFSGLLALGGAAITILTLLQFNFKALVQTQTVTPDIRSFGRAFLSYDDGGFVLPFEVITGLLLAAMVAAIMVAKKSKQ